ncbi:MAG: alkaline phosphatase PhoX [Actinomycetes bacterium]
MSTSFSRRDLLRRSGAAGLGIVFAGSIDAVAGPGPALAAAPTGAGYGPLVPDPAGVLSLPPGFGYTVVAEAGTTTLVSGEATPSDPDGTACFPSAAGATLVNNHEISGSEPHRVPALAGLTYDPGAGGGTTNIDVDTNGNRIREYVSLAGTHNNCAGGKTPWGTWLTCEETEARAGGALLKDHGYVFEVDPFDKKANEDPVPLKFLGRFAHEAVAVDPSTSVVYETEDADEPNGLYYRWVPADGFSGGKGAFRDLATPAGGDTAGTLQAMSCAQGSRHVADLSEATRPGTTYRVSWVDVPDRDAQTTPVRQQLSDGQVTRSHKLEGAWWGDRGAYFVASFARAGDGSVREHDGQVWFYDPTSETVTLKTIFRVNPDPSQDTHYDGPDNITVSPHGGVILAEDGEGIQHLVGVTEGGRSYSLARNELNGSEFAGATFSDDGRILFANIQSPGHVFAITGPWGHPRDAQGES